MVDSRIVPDLRWIAQRFPIYVTDGYSGPAAQRRTRRLPPLPRQALRPLQRPRGRHRAAQRRAPNATQLARDHPSRRTGPSRARTSPVPPFRWVGYDGDAGHGCGNHLHLSWEHAPAAPLSQLAEWVEVFRRRAPSEAAPAPRRQSRAAARPSGGLAADRPGGISPSAGGSRPHRRRRDRLLLGCGARCADASSHRLAALARPRRRRLRHRGRHDAGRLPRRARAPTCGALDGAPGGSRGWPARCRSANAWPRTRRPATWPRSATAMVSRRDQAQRRGARRARRRGQPPARLPARRRPARRRRDRRHPRRADPPPRRRRPLQPRQPAAAAAPSAHLPAGLRRRPRPALNTLRARRLRWRQRLELSSSGVARPRRPSRTSRCPGERVPVPVVRWLGRLKAAAARGQRRAGRARRRAWRSGSPRRATRSPPASTTTSSRSTSSRPARAPPRT